MATREHEYRTAYVNDRQTVGPTGRVRTRGVWHSIANVARKDGHTVVGTIDCNPNIYYRFASVYWPGGEAYTTCRACLGVAWAADPPFVLRA
jgi:hypothetical protein